MHESSRARSAVGVAAIAGVVPLRVTGADRIAFLHRMVTCDVKALAPGGAATGLFLTAKGRVVSEFLLAVLPDRVEMLAPAAARPGLRDGLARFVVADDALLEDRGGAAGLIALVGPRAAAAAARLLGGPLPAIPDPGAAEVRAAGGPALLLRCRRAGLPSVELLADAAALPALLAAVGEAARSEGGGPVGESELEVLRIENGVPRLGAEFGAETLPQEAGLESSVSFTKGCFLGQEPVARLQTQGHTNRGLAGLLPESLPAPGDAVLAAGKEIGRVTSAVASPTLGRPIALALLRHEASAPGTAVEVRGAAGSILAAVTSLPFVV